MGWVVLLFSCSCVFLKSVFADSDYVAMQEGLTKVLLTEYNKDIKPDHKVDVTVDMYVRNVKDIDIMKGTMEIQLTFRQRWKDNRLEYSGNSQYKDVKYLTLISGKEKQIWTPDTFFRNELESHVHQDLVPNEYIRVFPNGEVLYSSRLTLKTLCPVDLSRYPFDQQTCSISIASYGLTTEDIEYKWKEDSVQIKNLHLPSSYSLVSHVTDTCDVMTATGYYSCISAALTFSRESRSVVVSYYLPVSLLVLLSFLTLLVRPRHASARLMLVFGCLAGAVAVAMVSSQGTPPLPYSKAIDVYMGVSIFIIFFSLLANILILFVKERAEDLPLGKGVLEQLRSGSLASRLEICSSILLPLLFILNIIIALVM